LGREGERAWRSKVAGSLANQNEAKQVVKQNAKKRYGMVGRVVSTRYLLPSGGVRGRERMCICVVVGRVRVARSTGCVRVVWIRVGLSVTTVERWRERKGRDAIVVDKSDKKQAEMHCAWNRNWLSNKKKESKNEIVGKGEGDKEQEKEREHQKK
jgi:hypothetical protein